MELALAALPYEQQDRYKQLLAASETAGLSELNSISEELQVRKKMIWFLMDLGHRLPC
jgi:restriction endonuclease S subunit